MAKITTAERVSREASDRGIEFHAVAHRDTVFGLVVQFIDGLPGKGRGRREQSCEQECGK